jgi:hypothetical protein
MIANIALDDGLILPHSANPTGSNFRERQVDYHHDWALSSFLMSVVETTSAVGSAENWHLPLVLPRERRLLRAHIRARAGSDT